MGTSDSPRHVDKGRYLLVMTNTGGSPEASDSTPFENITLSAEVAHPSHTTAEVPWRPDALERLPQGPPGSDPFRRLVAAFLVAYPDVTAKAYLNDLKAWATWCDDQAVHPFAARRHHVDAWVKHMIKEPQRTTGRPAAPATVARRLSCLSKFYDYGMREVERIEHSPVANVRRPKVSEDSPTIGLDAAELDRLLTAAEADGTRSAALVSLLVYNGPAHRRGAGLRRRRLHLSTWSPGAFASCVREAGRPLSPSLQSSCDSSRTASVSATLARCSSPPRAQPDCRTRRVTRSSAVSLARPTSPPPSA